MKGEFLEPQNEGENPNNNMFSKLHHPFSHHFQLSHDSDDTPTPKRPTRGSGGGGSDGASIEVSRRPRGRPPGSKNKPKPPLVVTPDPHPPMSPYILEIPSGNDVVEALSRFSRLKNIGLCVLTGSGAVSDVTLRQPTTTTPSPATVTFHGRFDILSLSATFLPQTTSCHVPNTFSISLAGPQGQIVGGFVAGSLVAAATVFIVAATVNNPSYHRLPGEDDETRNTVSSSGGDDGGKGQSPSSGGGGDGSRGGGADSCGVSMYSCHMGSGSDVIWAPTARPPPPPPPY
ncbi:hypothetical protein Godav_003528 [Gossypium davidsonii]|uniref:AT-hook motif nuclear-localized protein n=1 Tax=Gossypium davidsonii TaxID=34287 RepID=A0A7J8SI28_GOSDV|nr:hypothetical protein [Gossypium davidsonii]